MGLKMTNNATSTLAGSITTQSTSLVVASGDGAKFPILEVGDWFPLTLVKIVGAEVFREVVRCTARALDVFTVERGAENSTALTFSAGDKVELRPTADVFSGMAEKTTLATKANLVGGNTFTGVQKVEVIRSKFTPLGSVSTAQVLSFSATGTYSLTATAALAITFSNPPAAGEDQTLFLKITNGGGRVTFPGAKVSKGVALGLTAAGKDMLAVQYDPEDNVYLIGFAFQDYK